MPTYREIQARLAMLLGEPHPAYPSEPVAWRYLADCAQLLFNQAVNSPVAWATRTEDVTINANQDIYDFSAANFGKDILVETRDDSDPNHVPSPVRRMSLQSSPYGGSDSYMPSSGDSFLNGARHTVQTFVFYRENGQVKIRVMPRPPEGAQPSVYRIYYEEAEINTDSDSNNFPLPTAGVPYLCAYTSSMLLPLTRWVGMSEEQNQMKRKEFAVSLGLMTAKMEKEWVRYLASDRQPGLTVMRGVFDDQYHGDVGGGWY